MGLSIGYQMKVKTDAEEARRLMGALRARAAGVSFDRVTEVREYDPPDGRYAFAEGREGDRWEKPGCRYLTRNREDGLEELVRVRPLHTLWFAGQTKGAETADFGLASHPAVVVHREDVVTYPPGCSESRQIGAGAVVEFPTRLKGWYSWSTACKTQYAARADRGGVENFLRAHLAIIAVVDECRRLGMTVKVSDDGGYWRHRNVERLVRELAKWDELVAGFVGQLGDALGDRVGILVAPIKERSDFEHLEARGVERLRRGGGKKGAAAAPGVMKGRAERCGTPRLSVCAS
jgi:hypothetical protein